MVCRYTVVQVAKRFVFICVALIGLVSCGTVYELYAPPNSTIHRGIEGNYENPDRYLIPESARKTYVATKAFEAPSPREQAWISRISMADIGVGETWITTHRIGNRFVIFSSKYQARQKALSCWQNKLPIFTSH